MKNFEETIRLREAKNYTEFRADYPKHIENLEAGVEAHFKCCENWRSGKAIEIFVADGALAVKYANGDWWHYTAGAWY